MALLLGLTLSPEATRADNECGAASNGVATCAASTGNFNEGIRYYASSAAGLTLTVEARTGGTRRRISGSVWQGTSSPTESGNGIGIFGSHGDGAGLRLVVQGDTHIIPFSGTQSVNSLDGIRISNGNGTGNRRITGSVTVEVNAEAQIGTSNGRFDGQGIHAIVDQGHKDSTTSNAGVRVDNAGAIWAKQRGIRARSHGFKVKSPAANHLNGRVEVIHSGSINAGEWGIHALSERNADVKAMVEAGGTITADKGIFAQTKGAAGPGGSGDVTVTSAGVITARSGRGIDARVASGTGTLGVTTTGGTITATDVGIHAISGEDAGATAITVGASSSITGNVHGVFAEHTGSAKVTVIVAGTVTGGSDASEGAIKIEAAGPASVTLTDEFSITGDILFDGNDENDTLTLTVGQDMRGEVMGDIAMVDSLVKNGAGTARLGGDVSFSGSSAVIDDGLLLVRGHIDLGDDGTLRVEDGARLALEIGGTDGDNGRVTAGTVTLARDSGGIGEVFVALVEGEEAAARARLENGVKIFLSTVPASTDAKMLDSEETVVGRVKDSGFVTQGDTGDRSNPPPGSGGDGGNDGGGGAGSGGGGVGSDSGSGRGAAGLIVSGALAYLLWDLGLFDAGALLGSEGSGRRYGTLVRSFSSAPSGIRSIDKGIEYRVQLLESAVPAVAAILPASGVATSLRAHLGDGFHADLTGTPNLSASFGRDSVSGSRYGLGAGWRTGVFSADIGYSHAALRARSTFSNLEGLGELSGQYGLRHDRVQANARLRLAGAGLSLSPSLSLFEGAVAREGYTASSRVWLSEVPSMSQDYRGWKAGLSLVLRSPLKAIGLRWSPELRLATTQLAGGRAGEKGIEQRDRTGALRLDTPARAFLPRTVHALGGGLTVAGGENWALRGGYAAMLADDALEHAAGAQLRMRF